MYNKAKATLVAQQINKPKRTERNFFITFIQKNKQYETTYSLTFNYSISFR